MTKRIQSERWLTHIRKILEQCLDDTSMTAGSNDETFKRALGWLDRLMKGEALSGKQAINFIETIRKRVRGKASFDWHGPIQLTAKQIQDEEREGRLTRFRDVNRKKEFATKLIMERVQEKIADIDFTDVDVLARFAEHVMSFDPIEVQEAEAEPELRENRPAAIPNVVLDPIMAKFPVKQRFPSNTWDDEHMAEVHAAHSPFSNKSY